MVTCGAIRKGEVKINLNPKMDIDDKNIENKKPKIEVKNEG